MVTRAVSVSSCPDMWPPSLHTDTARELKAPEGVTKEILKKLRNRKEFTILATVKQEPLNSGVILSIHLAEQR